jgi:prepilin-type N-terminal cleavage/methylation domain-containing protein
MKKKPQLGKASQRGFTLLEAMISTVIVTVGLCAMLAVFALAVSSTQTVQLDLLARQRATEALESIYTARQTAQITWDKIQNSGGTGNGIFKPGMLALTDPGPDGLDDTADDVSAGTITVPGPSGALTGTTPPDVPIVLSNFKRQVQITDVNNADGSTNPNLRQITITIQYPGAAGKTRSYTVQALISSYR